MAWTLPLPFDIQKKIQNNIYELDISKRNTNGWFQINNFINSNEFKNHSLTLTEYIFDFYFNFMFIIRLPKLLYIDSDDDYL